MPQRHRETEKKLLGLKEKRFYNRDCREHREILDYKKKDFSKNRKIQFLDIEGLISKLWWL